MIHPARPAAPTPPAGAPAPTMPGTIDGVCPTLPSSTSAYRIVRGDPAWPLLLARDVAGRAALVAFGIWLFGGRRDWRELVRLATSGAIGIELFVIWWVWQSTRGRVAP